MYYEKPSLDELTHIGVKGMKWGHRKSNSGTTKGVSKFGRAIVKTSAGFQKFKGKIARTRAEGFKIDRDSLVEERKAMLDLKSSSGKPLFTSKDLDDMVSTLEKNIQTYSKKADNYEQVAKMMISDLDASRKSKK